MPTVPGQLGAILSAALCAFLLGCQGPIERATIRRSVAGESVRIPLLQTVPLTQDQAETIGRAVTAGLLAGAHPNHSPFLNVRDFGAKGDGSADDTKAFQDAIDAHVNGGIIWVPPGRYSLRELTLRDGIILRGTSSSSNSPSPRSFGTILQSVGTGPSFISMAHNSTLESMVIERKNMTRDVNGVYAGPKVGRPRVENCRISGFLNGFLGDDCGQQEIVDSTFHDNSVGIRLSSGASDGLIRDNIVYANQSSGVYLSGGSNDQRIIGGKYEWNNREGILLENCGSIILSNLIVDRNGGAGISIKGGGIRGGTAISNCVLKRNGRTDTGDHVTNIHIQSVAQSVLLSNVIFSKGANDDGSGVVTPKYGIRFVNSSPTEVQLSNCSFSNGYTIAETIGSENVQRLLIQGGKISSSIRVEIPSIDANAIADIEVPLKGATIGDTVVLGSSPDLAGTLVPTAFVVKENYVTIRFRNFGTEPTVPAAIVWKINILK